MTCPLHGIERPCHICGVARVRAAITPFVHRDDPDEHDPTRARAIARARAERREARP
jgi:hypothetical protein